MSIIHFLQQDHCFCFVLLLLLVHLPMLFFSFQCHLFSFSLLLLRRENLLKLTVPVVYVNDDNCRQIDALQCTACRAVHLWCACFYVLIVFLKQMHTNLLNSFYLNYRNISFLQRVHD